MIDISFIVPLYNQEAYILPCLNSIVDSGLNPDQYEVIVWNDGSTDNSEALVAEFVKQRSNIRLVTNTNHGVSFSRNQALQQAVGRYVWFVDSDDLVNSGSVKDLVAYSMTANLEMLAFNWKSLLPDGRFEPGIHPITDSPVQSGRDVYVNTIITMAPWSFLYKRDFLLNNNLTFPENYKTCEDIQFNQKALFLAEKVAMSSQVGYIYRHLHSSATKGQGNTVVNDQIRRLKDELEWFSGKNDAEFLHTIVYRNLREINVWLAWADKDDRWFDLIRQILKGYTIKIKVNVPTMFVWLMKHFPKQVYLVQRWMNRLRRTIVLKLSGCLTKG